MPWNVKRQNTSTVNRKSNSLEYLLVAFVLVLGVAIFLMRDSANCSHDTIRENITSTMHHNKAIPPKNKAKSSTQKCFEKTSQDIKDDSIAEQIKYYEKIFGKDLPDGIKTHIYFLKTLLKKFFLLMISMAL